MSNKQFELLIFDWDGTISNSTAHIAACIQAACRDCGLVVPSLEQSSYVIGLGVEAAIQALNFTLSTTEQQTFSERYRFHYFNNADAMPLFPGIAALLRSLTEKGYLLAIATGKSKAGLSRALEVSKLAPLFTATRCADETLSKPNPMMLFELLDECQCEAEKALMIGDTTHDLQLAENASVASVAVSYGAQSDENFARFSPLYCAATVASLSDFLLALR